MLRYTYGAASRQEDEMDMTRINPTELKQAVAAMSTVESSTGATRYAIVPSPIGELLLVSDGERLTGLYLETQPAWPQKRADWRWEPRAFREVIAQLDAYFAGELHDFDLPVYCAGTPFQQKVWAALRTIPHGITISYAELAQRIGQPSAVRAVGLANGRNPVSIIVPCHRVIGAGGSLTGYSGGIERKRWLLRHEGVALREDTASLQPKLL
jgi:methylated-DNA-[protein]-cysteine S-methyltransferase